MDAYGFIIRRTTIPSCIPPQTWILRGRTERNAATPAADTARASGSTPISSGYTTATRVEAASHDTHADFAALATEAPPMGLGTLSGYC